MCGQLRPIELLTGDHDWRNQNYKYKQLFNKLNYLIKKGGCHGRDRDRMVVGFITTYAISSYHH
jgi:hypothetical protein